MQKYQIKELCNNLNISLSYVTVGNNSGHVEIDDNSFDWATGTIYINDDREIFYNNDDDILLIIKDKVTNSNTFKEVVGNKQLLKTISIILNIKL